MSNIFVSYASEDRERIAPLVARFEKEGWSVWWDRSLIAGRSFTEEIQEHLDQAMCVVVVWSKYSVNSAWCRDEANEGLEKNCLVPLCIDDVRPPLGFRSSQTVSMTTWPDKSGDLELLLEGIRRVLNPSNDSTFSIAAESSVAPINPRSNVHARSIAILPFVNLSNNPEYEYFCDGLADDVTIDLTHIPQLHVISRQATYHFKNNQRDVTQIAKELGVNFILQGSVRRAGNRVRVTAQLIEASSRQTVWSNRYDRDVVDVLEVQDELVDEIVVALDVQLISGEVGRHRSGKCRDPESLELLYKGIFEFYKYEKSANFLANSYFEQFIRREPDSILGYVWQVNVWSFSLIVGWQEPQVALQNLGSWVDKSLAIDPDDARALTGATLFKAMEGDLDAALQSADRAVSVLPNLDEAWFVRGWIMSLLGKHHDAVVSLERAMVLCPIPIAIRLGVLSTAYRLAGRYEDSIRMLETCKDQFPDFIFAHSGLALGYGMQGNNDKAKQEIALLLEKE